MSRLGRRIVLLILILSVGALLCVRTIRGAEDGSAVEANSRKAYADKIRETYEFRFGKDEISLPGSAAAVGGDFLQSVIFRMLPIAATAIRRHITSGARRSTPMHFAPPSIAPV